MTSVYRYYDIDDQLLYVGITSRGITRNAEHNWKEWWPLVRRQMVEHCATREQASQIERDAIKAERPRFNIQHAIRPMAVSAPPMRVTCLQEYAEWKGIDHETARIRLLTFALDIIDGRRRGGLITGNRPQQEKHLARARKSRQK